jgi:hypothetical protein
MSGNQPIRYHILRQAVFEQALLLMEGMLGRKGSLIDLGAGHCKFSLVAKAMGWRPTALDVRSARVPEMPDDVGFILGDVNSSTWSAKDYDLIVCLGVYYHLDQEMQHRLLEKCRGRPIILDTHFANPKGQQNRFTRALGETHEKNGEMGADYDEAGDLDETARKSTALRASFDNPTSWWQTKDSLINTLHDYGWPHVWTFDYDQMERFQRTFFICYTLDQSGTGVSGIRF